MAFRQYDPPSNYGIPNPLGPRVHNWKGGLYNEGSLFHGPIYTRPGYKMPWVNNPMNGLADDEVGKAKLVGGMIGAIAGIAAVLIVLKLGK